MAVAIVTGSSGLVGAAVSRLFMSKGLDVVGMDNDMRTRFFGPEASTAWQVRELSRNSHYKHVALDIRDKDGVQKVFERYGTDVLAVVHCAAQPSHDWAARDPSIDFEINATGTLILLEAMRHYAPHAAMVFTSTNKVYGDRPNLLPFCEHETRYEIAADHPWHEFGIPEEMSVDDCLHSLFGASKLSADVMVQEYGRYFGMRTASFRCGCITGPGHSSVALHGFLAYLIRCALQKRDYTIIGYNGKQVRDNIHATDLAAAFWCFVEHPSCGEVFNMGGGRQASCSVREAIALAEELTGRTISVNYQDAPRTGDHKWWISDVRKFRSRYPGWSLKFDTKRLLTDICDGMRERLHAGDWRYLS